MGAASVGFLAKGNSSLQLASSPSMRGRVMALWAVAFLGSTPIGGPIAGAVSEQFGGRAGLALGAAACLLAAGLGALVLRRLDLAEPPPNYRAVRTVPSSGQLGGGSGAPQRPRAGQAPRPVRPAAALVTEQVQQPGAA